MMLQHCFLLFWEVHPRGNIILPMSAVGINHVTVLVNDKEKALKFYSDVLGLEIFPVGKSTWMRLGNQFLHITQSSGKSISGSFYHFAIEVDSFKEYVKRLIDNGVKVFELDKDLNKILINTDLDNPTRQFFVKDPDGNLIEIVDSQNPFFKKGIS
jgi:catechol 2,3-dioxygenase-like lactoylglutathione lyase family enzyme